MQWSAHAEKGQVNLRGQQGKGQQVSYCRVLKVERGSDSHYHTSDSKLYQKLDHNHTSSLHGMLCREPSSCYVVTVDLAAEARASRTNFLQA